MERMDPDDIAALAKAIDRATTTEAQRRLRADVSLAIHQLDHLAQEMIRTTHDLQRRLLDP